PILIYGPVGNGKSHFIHSMSYGLSSTIGQKNIFVTNGVKFSIGVNLAIKEGFIDSLEKIINDCKVIIIDDIHLMLINKENKQFISRVISGSMQSNKQVVFSSLFSPQELEPLENMLGIQFSQGWMVDIKQPNPQTYRLILNQILGNMDIKLSEEQIKNFFINKSMDFKTVNKTLFRMKKLEKYLSPLNQSLLHQDMISMLLGDKDDFSMPSEGEIKGANVYSSQAEDSFYKWGFFCPKGMKEYINYMGAKLKETSSKKLSMDIEWKNVFVEEYDPDEIYGIPFKIGNYVLDKNINGLIVMGPPPTSALSSKEQEFSHLTEKILESMNIKTAWIYSNKLKAESVYLTAILDLI
ncbi:MAG: DnaA/Hda family protein, partial [Elusimicrobiales bacterium]|nr:DnaA/Hda family protein [Elusimicrobiales bacterium]